MTPFTPDDELDEEGLRGNIRHIRQLGTHGGGCTWGMGEFWSLTREERMRVFDVVADEAGGDWPIGAHVTHTAYKEMLALADHAEQAGFDLLIAAAPYMVTKTEQQVEDYIRLLADNTPLAIMFYNSPQFGIVVSAEGLERICRIPNVVGVKEASFNQALSIETHVRVGRDAIISTPDEWILSKGKELGFEQQVIVRQHVGLALRPARAQLLRPVHRPRHAGRPGPGVLRRPRRAGEASLGQVVGQDCAEVRRGSACTLVQVLGRADGHGGRPRPSAARQPDRRREGRAQGSTSRA